MTLAELKANKRWFLWNYSPGKSGKVTKVPMSATGGKTGTSEDYRSTWVDYNEALLAKDKYKVSGIRYSFLHRTLYFGVLWFDIKGY